MNHKELSKFWSSNNTIEPEALSPKSGRKVLWRCNEGHEFSREFRKFIKSQSCPVCSGRRLIASINSIAVLHPELLALAQDKGFLYGHTLTTKLTTNFLCKNCNSYYIATPQTYLNSSRTCRSCRSHFPKGTTLAEAFPELLSFWVSPYDPTKLPYGSTVELSWRCGENHFFTAQAAKLARKKRYCSICAALLTVAGVNDLATTHPKLAKQWHPNNTLTPTELAAGSNRKVRWLCRAQGHSFLRTVVGHVITQGRCPSCNELSWGESHLELEVFTFLENILPGWQRRQKLNGVEIDLMHKESKLCFEVNGNYWHSDALLLKHQGVTALQKHSRKQEHALALEKTLLFIWEDDWKKRRNEIEAALRIALIDNADIHPSLTILSKG